MTAQQELDWTRAGQMLYAAAGVTTAHEGATHLPQIGTIKRASDAGANLIDVVAYPFITDLDGSPQGRTAFFTTPYLSGGPGGEKDWRGEPTFPQDLVNQAVSRVYGMGVPLIVHTNGDAAIDMFLKAYELARKGDFSKPWNVTTIHTQFLRRDQIPSFVKHGIRPSLYTLHTYYFADAHIANRGREQANYISPMREAIDAGRLRHTHRQRAGRPISTGRPPTMKVASGRISIFGGINRLNGSVALVHDNVTIGELVSTKMAGPPELMALENDFANTLRSVDGFHVRGGKLRLLRGDTVVAEFRSDQ